MAKRSGLTAALIGLAITACVLAALLYHFRGVQALFRNGLAVARAPHASIELIAFDQRGHRLNSLDFFDTWRPTLIVRDHTGAVCYGVQYGITTPRLAIPADERVSFELLWPVSGFGKVLLSADNSGRGYRVSAGAFTRVELVPELARTRVGELERWISHRKEAHPLPDEVTQELTFAHHQLARVDAVHDPRERAALAMPALRAALQASEQMVLADASGAIAENRNGSLLIKIIDPHGTEVPSVKIRVAQTRPEFLFGVGSGNRGYPDNLVARMKQLGLNYAAVDLNWAELEPSAGKFAFAAFDRRFDLANLKHEGFALRGRGLAEGSASAVPPFVAPMGGDWRALSRALPAQLAPIIKHYKNLIEVWQIEQADSAWSSLDLNNHTADIIKAIAAEIRKDAPDARIMINIAEPLGEDVAARYNRRLLGVRAGEAPPAADPYAAVQHLASAGVDFDLIGLEFCCSGSRERADLRVQPSAIDLFRFARELDRWSNLGKPLQIGALAFASSGSSASWWHAPADEGVQADYLADTATIAYANPHVQALTWPALFDADAQSAGTGLIDRGKRPKAAYDRLSALLAGWRSGGDVTTGSDGLANFQGAPGDYRLTAQTTPEPIEGTARIHQNSTDIALMSITTIVPLPGPGPLPNDMANPGGQDTGSQPMEPFVLEPPPPVEPPYQPPSPESPPAEPPYEPPGP